MDLPDKTQGQPTPPPKKVQAPVASGAKLVKRPATKRFMDFMFAESPKDVSRNIGKNVVVPHIKRGVQEAFNAFINGMFWGGGQNPGQAFMQGTVLRPGMTSYNLMSQPSGPMGMAQAAVSNRTAGNYQDIVFPTMQMAEAVLANLYELFNQYRMVSVGDLYELAGIKGEISDNAIGWTSLDGARITAQGAGFLLSLPRPHQLSSY